MTLRAANDRYYHISRRSVRLVFLALLGGGLLLIVAAPLWLTALGRWLMVSAPPRAADALIVLGGGAGEREAAAAELYRQGYATRLITTGDRVKLPGETRTFAEVSADTLVAAGVPREAITLLTEPTSTREEALASRVLLAAWGARSLIIVSDPYHMRRSLWTFQEVYGAEVALIPVAATNSWFRLERWWTRERDLLAVLQEYEKMGLYLLQGWLF